MINFLKEKISQQGVVINDEILSVDSFLNHQLDISLCLNIGKIFADFFAPLNPTVILTAESSGIVPAFTTGMNLNIPVIIVRKVASKIMKENYISTSSFSFTRKAGINLFLNKNYLKETDRVLIIDDFLSNGDLSKGLINLILQNKATPVGAGFVIEKSFLPGRKMFEESFSDIKVFSLARIASLKNNTITFMED